MTAASGRLTDHAACADLVTAGAVPATAWDTDPHARPTPLNNHAKTICHTRCPVQHDCLATAIALTLTGDPAGRIGIWGGLDPSERATLTGHGTPP